MLIPQYVMVSTVLFLAVKFQFMFVVKDKINLIRVTNLNAYFNRITVVSLWMII